MIQMQKTFSLTVLPAMFPKPMVAIHVIVK